MNVVRCHALWALMVGAAFVGSTLAEKADLSWKFKANDKGEYAMTRNRVAKLDLNGNELEIGISSTVDMQFTVQSVDDKGAVLVLKMERLQLNVDSPIEQVAYDSAGLIPGDESSLWPNIKDKVEKIVGAEATVTVNPQGNVSDIKFAQDVVDALNAESPNPQVQRFLSGVFDEAGVKSMIKQVFVPLPEKGVDVGGNWSTKETVDRPPFGKAHVDRTLTYVGKDEGSGDFDNIAIGTKVSFEMNEGENAEEIKLEITEQEGKGNVEFDAEAGRAREMEFVQTMKMEIVFGGNDVVQNVTETTTLKQGKSDPFVAPKKEEPAKEEPKAGAAPSSAKP